MSNAASRATRRIAIGALLAGTVLGGLAVGEAVAQDRSIKVWFGRQEFIPDDQFAQFREEHPGIDVQFEVIRLEDVSSQLILALRSGTAPDLVQISARDVEQLARGGVLKDVTHLAEAFEERFPETFGQLTPLTWEAASDSGGRVYGAAFFAQSMYLAYRTDWLDEAGIELPLETTDRVLEAARAMAEQAPERHGFALVGCCAPPVWELPLFFAMGGQSADGVLQLESEAGIAWIDFYQTLMRDGIAHPDTPAWDSGQMRAAFLGGHAGMMIEGEHIWVEVAKAMPYEEGKWGFERLPNRPGQTEPHFQAGLAFPFVVTSASLDDEAVLLALDYLARPEIAGQVAIRYQPTTNMAVAEEPGYLAAKPWAPDVAPLAATVESMPTHPTRVIQMFDILQELRDRIIASANEDAADVAAEFQKRLDAAAGS
jgi:ABC-type glycerol-3-phosphate transport system substrate-binding protein